MLAPILPSTSSPMTLPWAIGDQASVTIRGSAAAARAASLPKNGCTSIWFTAGSTPLSSMIRFRWAGSKFETPMRGPAVLGELAQGLPGGDEVTVVLRRQRPVDEEQVDPVEAELLQRRLERATRVVRAVEAVVELGGHVELVAGDAGGGDGPADASSLPYICAVSMCR